MSFFHPSITNPCIFTITVQGIVFKFNLLLTYLGVPIGSMVSPVEDIIHLDMGVDSFILIYPFNQETGVRENPVEVDSIMVEFVELFDVVDKF